MVNRKCEKFNKTDSHQIDSRSGKIFKWARYWGTPFKKKKKEPSKTIHKCRSREQRTSLFGSRLKTSKFSNGGVLGKFIDTNSNVSRFIIQIYKKLFTTFKLLRLGHC